ncbi:hypothetical protein FQN60_000247 [Etheostoma spectabile]|uniref:Uncharacterized protein n=1 Tax=Etheostoma spectabile TaxID=54343 RepID=A0A5J5D4D8_9PERO|nr:hypothetical protein FQN60_000247 [Etheostoma spectabile]
MSYEERCGFDWRWNYEPVTDDSKLSVACRRLATDLFGIADPEVICLAARNLMRNVEFAVPVNRCLCQRVRSANLLQGAIAGTAEPSRQKERERSEEERPDRLSTALAGSMEMAKCSSRPQGFATCSMTPCTTQTFVNVSTCHTCAFGLQLIVHIFKTMYRFPVFFFL